MPYTEPQVAAELLLVASNPAVMSGAGGPGVSFKTRIALRSAAQDIEPGITNLEVYQPTKLSTTIVTKATAKVAR